MSDKRQRAIDALVGEIVSMYPDDSLAAKAREELRIRNPEAVERLRPYEPNNRDFFQTIEPLYDKSPYTVEQLLKAPPAAQIRQILDFKETGWGAPNRDGLISAICSAADQNVDWAFKLLAALLDQGEKDNDIWCRLLWKLKWESMSVDQRNWLLDVFNTTNGYSAEFLAAYTQLVLLRGCPSGPDVPDTIILAKQLKLTFVLWEQTNDHPGWKVETPDGENDWIFEAINRPPGLCCEFWLKYTEFLQKGAPEADKTWPAEIESVMNEIVQGKTRGQKLGLALLGHHLASVRYMVPTWTKRQLYPCFDFTARGDAAFPNWIGFIGYGSLSRELAMEMPPYFATAFPRISEMNENIAKRFAGLVAAISISGHWNVNQDNWLKNFLSVVDEKLRRKWLSELARFLKGSLIKDKQEVWKNWLFEYWIKRLEGIPHAVTSAETEGFYKLALSLGPLAHEAVPLLKRLPTTSVEWSHVFLDFEKNTLFEEDPEGLVSIVAWWLPQARSIVASAKEVVAFIEKLPANSTLLHDLRLIEDEITRLRPDFAPDVAKAITHKFGHA